MSTDTTTQTTSSDGEAGTTGNASGTTNTFTPEQESALARIVAETVAKAVQGLGAAAGAAGGTDGAAGDTEDPNAAVQARLDAMEAHTKKVQEQAKRAVLQRHLPNLISSEVLKLAPAIELTDDGELTADSARKLEAWKTANPYYFKAAAAGTTAPPGSNGSSRGAPSAETQQRLRQSGIEPDAWRKRPGARVALAMTGGEVK